MNQTDANAFVAEMHAALLAGRVSLSDGVRWDHIGASAWNASTAADEMVGILHACDKSIAYSVAYVLLGEVMRKVSVSNSAISAAIKSPMMALSKFMSEDECLSACSAADDVREAIEHAEHFLPKDTRASTMKLAVAASSLAWAAAHMWSDYEESDNGVTGSLVTGAESVGLLGTDNTVGLMPTKDLVVLRAPEMTRMAAYIRSRFPFPDANRLVASARIQR